MITNLEQEQKISFDLLLTRAKVPEKYANSENTYLVEVAWPEEEEAVFYAFLQKDPSTNRIELVFPVNPNSKIYPEAYKDTRLARGENEWRLAEHIIAHNNGGDKRKGSFEERLIKASKGIQEPYTISETRFLSSKRKYQTGRKRVKISGPELLTNDSTEMLQAVEGFKSVFGFEIRPADIGSFRPKLPQPLPSLFRYD